MVELKDKMVLYVPNLIKLERDGLFVFVDPESPNWIGTDGRGSTILDLINGRNPFADLVGEYARIHKIEGPKAWLHVHDFIREAMRCQIVSTEPMESPPYQGRASTLRPTRLREFWFHTNNSCNLTCTHCLVSSHPGG